jgi:hypothetical protein
MIWGAEAGVVLSTASNIAEKVVRGQIDRKST